MIRHDSGVDILSRDTDDFDQAFFDGDQGEEALGRLVRRASERWNSATATTVEEAVAAAAGATTATVAAATNPADDVEGDDDDAPSDEHEAQDHVARIVRRASERWMTQSRGGAASSAVSTSDESLPSAP